MAITYQPYPEYKDSTANWLGSIPFSWKSAPLKYLATFEGGGTPSKDKLEYWNGDIPWVSPKDMKSSVVYTSIDKITERAVNESSTKIIKENSLIIVVRSGILQHSIPVAINQVPVTLNQDMKAMRFHDWFDVKYAQYIILGNQKTLLLEWGKQGATVESIEQEYLSGTTFPLPPILEQQKIVAFLDHETAKIDTLIDKQQQLIKLLKEKRQAVISHAVTKGLNPDVPMKNSGVEWLGEVPEHWGIVPLKYLTRFFGGGTPSKANLAYWTDGDIPWVSPKDMKTFWLSDTQDKITEQAVKESSTAKVEAGALLMVVRSGILQRTIPIAVNTVTVTLNQDMKALNFNERILVSYAANYILGYTQSLLLEWSKEGATVESIEYEYLANSLFPVPPLNEQAAINMAIATRMELFEKLENHAKTQIGLLQERRAALISAAVTGKIDVRGWQANKEAA